jgi:hypothetical protein
MHIIIVINHFDDVWIMYYFCAECHVIVSDNLKKVIILAEGNPMKVKQLAAYFVELYS